MTIKDLKEFQIDKIVYTNNINISLRINNMALAILKIPKNAKIKNVLEFLKFRKEWIVKNKEIKQAFIDKNKDIVNYKKISLYNGEVYNIKIGTRNKKNKDLLEFKTIKNLSNYLTKLAQPIVDDKVKYYSKIIDVRPSKITIENTRTRWGVCTSNGEVKINFRAILLDETFLKYIIVHELCHLKQFDHSKAFWDLLKIYVPDCLNKREEMKEFGFLFDLYR